MEQAESRTGTHEPFNQFNFNFEVLKLIEELLKAACTDMSVLKVKIARGKIAELWDSVEREMLMRLESDDKAEGERYDV